MKIGPKASLIAASGGLLTLVLSYLAMSIFIVPQIIEEENDVAVKSFVNVQRIVKNDEDALSGTALDWGVWDDTYKFLSDKNSDYISSNLQEDSLSALSLNFMIFTDINGNLFYTNTYQIEKNKYDFANQLLEYLEIAQHAKEIEGKGGITSGIINFQGTPIALSICEVTTNDRDTPSNGYLVIGRYITSAYLEYIEKITESTIDENISFLSDINYTADPDFYVHSLGDNTCWIKEGNDDLTVISRLNGVYEEKSVPFMFAKERYLYKKTVASFDMFVVGILMFLLISAVVSLHSADHLILKRLQRLNKFIDAVIKNKDTKARLKMRGKDEISALTDQVNKMLSDLDEALSVTRKNEARQRLIMETTTDGYFDLSVSDYQVYISSKWAATLDLDISENNIVNLVSLNRYIYPEDKKRVRREFFNFLIGKNELYHAEYRIIKADGVMAWIALKGKTVQYDENQRPSRLVGTITDITSNKLADTQKQLIRETDEITGLKNRHFFKSVISEADSDKECLFSIIIVDIDGLKFINDRFGKENGDKLLKIIADILKTSCLHGEMPIRWGGDEFIIFIRDNNNKDTEELISKIRHSCSEIREFPDTISVSIGWAKRSEKHPDVESVIKYAEERMHRNKLLQIRSQRSAVISSLAQTLHEKHIETEEHIQRAKKLCRLIGKKLNLRQDELDELELLGTLHDIGKVGIPESILLKPGKLTDDEWEIMTKHTEIGYRIAISTPDLAHVADEILYHHEKYDGNGYPHGLKGEQIPKLSRLIAIVDAYDAMVHERVYKKAMSKECAIQELIRCSGTQFDPDMVDIFIKLLLSDDAL